VAGGKRGVGRMYQFRVSLQRDALGPPPSRREVGNIASMTSAQPASPRTSDRCHRNRDQVRACGRGRRYRLAPIARLRCGVMATLIHPAPPSSARRGGGGKRLKR